MLKKIFKAFLLFLKPTVWNSLSLIFLTTISFLLSRTENLVELKLIVGDNPTPWPPLNYHYGFPLESLHWTSKWEIEGNRLSVDYLNFLLDLLFWYLIACLIIFIYLKIKKVLFKRKDRI